MKTGISEVNEGSGIRQHHTFDCQIAAYLRVFDVSLVVLTPDEMHRWTIGTVKKACIVHLIGSAPDQMCRFCCQEKYSPAKQAFHSVHSADKVSLQTVVRLLMN
jgi:hypothetical protein